MNEERFVPWQEPEVHDPNKSRNRFESIVDFLRRSQEGDDESEDYDDETTKRRKKGKSSKWRKFFRGLFGEGASENEETNETLKKPFILFEPVQDQDQTVDHTVNKTESELTLPKVVSSETPNELDDGRQSDITHDGQAITPNSSEAYGGGGGAIPLREAEATPMAQQELSPQKERSEQRATPIGALLAIDYLQHRSKKRLEKELKEKQKAQAAELKAAKKQVTELKNSHIAKAREQATPKPKASAHEATPVKQQELKQKQPEVQVVVDRKQPEAQAAQSSRYEKPRPDSQHEQQLQKIVAQQEKQRELAHEQAKLRQQQQKNKTTFEELTRTTAQNETAHTYTEKAHERRNEVRDFADSTRKQPTAATQMQNTNNTAHTGVATAQTRSVTPVNKNDNSSVSQTNAFDDNHLQHSVSYASAVKLGFIGAVICILLLFAGINLL